MRFTLSRLSLSLALLAATHLPSFAVADPGDLFLFAQFWNQEGAGPTEFDYLPSTLLCTLEGTCSPSVPGGGGEEGFDFGDAPDSYKTTLASAGPRHDTASGGPYLGAVRPDTEPDGRPNLHAEGDDGHRQEAKLDRLFGEGGGVDEPFGMGASIFDLALQDDGKILAAGYVKTGPGDNDSDMAVARFHENGSLDMDFGTNGLAQIDFGLPRETASGVAIQSDGKIVISGKRLIPPVSGERDFFVARLKSDGTPDEMFSEDGKATFNVDQDTSGANDVLAYVLDGAIKVVAVGTSNNRFSPPPLLGHVVMLNEDGTPDVEFAASGRRGKSGTANTIVPRQDDRFMIGGGTGEADSNYQMFELYDDGDFTPFADFGTFGIGLGAPDEDILGLFIDNDEGIVAVGPGGGDFKIFKVDFFGDGLEDDFGNMGSVTTDLGGEDVARAVVQRLDGRFLVAGSSVGAVTEAVLVQYLANGNIDTTFGLNGVARTGGSDESLSATTVLVQPDAKVLVAGNGETSEVGFRIARLGAFEDDEEGVRFEGGILLERGTQGRAVVTISGSDGEAQLSGWIDFNGDGTFSGPGEQVAGPDRRKSLSNGPVNVDFTVPAGAVLGNTYSRWRVSTAAGLGPDGEALDGEVEDYRVIIIDPAAPVSVAQVTIIASTTAGAVGHSISADGMRRVFTSGGDLVGANADRNIEVFLLDLLGGSLRQITHTRPTASSLSAAISGDGNTIAFESRADLVGQNRVRERQLFAFDVPTGEFTQISQTIDVFDHGIYEDISLSHDGTRIAFGTDADLIDENGDGNIELFLYDSTGPTLSQLTDHSFSTSPGEINTPLISGNGNKIVFTSDIDLVGMNAEPNKNDELFLYDIASMVFTQITVTDNDFHRVPTISFDGTRITFDGVTDVAGPNAGFNQEVYLYDTGTMMFTPITPTGSGILNTNPSISGDGHRVSFQSNSDFAGMNADSGAELFIFDTRNSAYTQITNSAETANFLTSHLNADGTLVAFDGRRDLTGENPEGNSEAYIGIIPPFAP